MTTRRNFLATLCWALVGVSLSILPYKIEISGSAFDVVTQSALAKSGNNGNGGGNGNGGNGGNGGGNGNGGGGNGGGGNGKSGSSNSSSGKSSGVSATTRGDDNSSLEVLHVDGMSEEVKRGRYIMKDAKGRTIVNRRATFDDVKRLQSFSP
ncbi:hypothetical protein RGR602_PC01144 (plasmid) [Rhizobium gallicum bv. gallicum R602sp]|uniref:Glycine-rich cell wall protein n=1 Tax=Rhizobium gallicum bv. gallicum R602sp TaxID=1041138 RepID=A0A0B4XB05_9HYPH|nr:hypothetical protein [Rhizobium gallicum]AJD45174.1 hypothetical protein RGR602_PC01144 [Rhizobium gallicum bv. gallicum R602sp]